MLTPVAVSPEKRNDTDGAIADYSRAIEIDPRKPKVFYNRGLARNHKNDLDGAVADYTMAIKLNPRYVEAYNNRGATLKIKNDLDGAIADYTMAIKIDPKNSIATIIAGLPGMTKTILKMPSPTSLRQLNWTK